MKPACIPRNPKTKLFPLVGIPVHVIILKPKDHYLVGLGPPGKVSYVKPKDFKLKLISNVHLFEVYSCENVFLGCFCLSTMMVAIHPRSATSDVCLMHHFP